MDIARCQPTRPGHILNLPNETLDHIFSYVTDWTVDGKPLPLRVVDYRRDGQKTIKNIRLVCRRFCDTSSHLLLVVVTVSMEPSSLARLEEVSRHPLISKRVRTVRVILKYFGSMVAHKLNEYFVPYQQSRLEDIVVLFRHLERSEGSEELSTEAVPKSRRIIDSWDKLIKNAPESSLDDVDRKNISIIKRAHKLYREAYLEQERMLTDGSFVRAVADAIARMPVARFLFITDSDRSLMPGIVPFIKGIETPSLLVAKLVEPTTWRLGGDYVLGPPPVELLSQIPLAIYKAGVMLEHVTYRIEPMDCFSSLFKCDGDLNDLKAAMQQLKGFRFRSEITLYTDMSEEEEDDDDIRYLKGFLEAFTDTDSIQEISIGMNFEQPAQGRLLTAGSFLLTRTWPQLPKFKGRVELTLDQVNLLSGSWADVLDVMRANTVLTSNRSSIDRPSGAECYSLPEYLKIEIFSETSEGTANLYIRGLLHLNPLRQITESDDESPATSIDD
ncbi:hypothetical protein AAE478_006184 [Parahypoxylon ruwenzoriense]